MRAKVEIPFLAPEKRQLKIALLSWIAIWPSITVLLFIGRPVLAGLPLPLMTLALTAVVSPLMSLVIMPLLTKRLRAWIEQ